MAQFVNIYPCDLRKGPVETSLKHMYLGDVEANRVGVNVTDGGEAVALSGTCSGTAILCNGGTVALTGTVDGSLAYVDLPSAVYTVEGPVEIYVTLTQGDQTTTLLTAHGNAVRTDSGVVIDPGTIIPSVAALISDIEDAVASIPEDYSELSADVVQLKSDMAEVKPEVETLGEDVSYLRGAINTLVPNQMLGISYEWGNTNASGVPATEATNQHRLSNLIPVKAGTKIRLKSSNLYNIANAIAYYDLNGDFTSRSVFAINKDAQDQIATIQNDGYIRRSYALLTGNAMTEDIDLHIRDLWELSIDDRPTKTLNTIEKVYDYNSQELNFGYISKTTGQKTITDRWKYVVHNCKQGDVFVYNGLCANPTAVAIFFNSTNSIIGYVGSEDTKTFYKDYVIRIPFFCTRVCFNWFTAEGYNPCNVYRFTTNTDLSTSIRQNDILGLIGYDRYKGLKININGDSISTPTAGKWANFIQNQIDCTFKTVGVGGTRMTGEINSTTRIATLDADADIVLTNGGANDWAQNITIGSLETLDDPTTFAGAVQLYIERVMTQCPNARIICMGTNYVNFKNRFSVDPLIGEKNNNGDRITDFNDMYRKVCEYNSVEFINIYELCGINRYNYATYLEEDSHDYGNGYVHPNNAGGKKYLDVILGYLFYNKNS